MEHGRLYLRLLIYGNTVFRIRKRGLILSFFALWGQRSPRAILGLRALIHSYPKVWILLSWLSLRSQRFSYPNRGRTESVRWTEVEVGGFYHPNYQNWLPEILLSWTTYHRGFSYPLRWADYRFSYPRTTNHLLVIFLSKLPTILRFYYLYKLSKEILGASHDEPRIKILANCSERARLRLQPLEFSTYGIVSESHRQ